MEERQKFNGTGQGRIFKNPFLEMFTKTNHLIAMCTDIPLIITFICLGLHFYRLPVLEIIGLYVIGMISWSLMEYILHRWVFHFINESKWSKRFHYIVHGVHHDYPRDEERLFMPPLPTLLYAGIFFCIFYIFLGHYTYYFMAGFVNGYSIYAFMHWAIHAFTPPKRLAFLWKHHNMHHYRTQQKAFGVSSTFWDHVFGTLPPEK